MREIKFRAYCNDEKRYLKGDFSIGIESMQFRGKYGEIFDNILIEQFTGLTDKNGKEIYEGDLVKINWNSGTQYLETIAEVKYGVKGCWFYLDDHKRSDIGFYFKHHIHEVIGNIHENPGLLTN